VPFISKPKKVAYEREACFETVLTLFPQNKELLSMNTIFHTLTGPRQKKA
jgi:hypothetical protein